VVGFPTDHLGCLKSSIFRCDHSIGTCGHQLSMTYSTYKHGVLHLYFLVKRRAHSHFGGVQTYLMPEQMQCQPVDDRPSPMLSQAALDDADNLVIAKLPDVCQQHGHPGSLPCSGAAPQRSAAGGGQRSRLRGRSFGASVVAKLVSESKPSAQPDACQNSSMRAAPGTEMEDDSLPTVTPPRLLSLERSDHTGDPSQQCAAERPEGQHPDPPRPACGCTPLVHALQELAQPRAALRARRHSRSLGAAMLASLATSRATAVVAPALPDASCAHAAASQPPLPAHAGCSLAPSRSGLMAEARSPAGLLRGCDSEPADVPAVAGGRLSPPTLQAPSSGAVRLLREPAQQPGPDSLAGPPARGPAVGATLPADAGGPSASPGDAACLATENTPLTHCAGTRATGESANNGLPSTDTTCGHCATTAPSTASARAARAVALSSHQHGTAAPSKQCGAPATGAVAAPAGGAAGAPGGAAAAEAAAGPSGSAAGDGGAAAACGMAASQQTATGAPLATACARACATVPHGSRVTLLSKIAVSLRQSPPAALRLRRAAARQHCGLPAGTASPDTSPESAAGAAASACAQQSPAVRQSSAAQAAAGRSPRRAPAGTQPGSAGSGARLGLGAADSAHAVKQTSPGQSGTTAQGYTGMHAQASQGVHECARNAGAAGSKGPAACTPPRSPAKADVASAPAMAHTREGLQQWPRSEDDTVGCQATAAVAAKTGIKHSTRRTCWHRRTV
jgi:hypothetical protein